MVHGPEAIHRLVEESTLSYPVSVRRLEREYALENVDIDGEGNSVMVAELLGEVEVDAFQDRDELVAELEPVFEDHRSDRGSGLVGRVKRIFR